MNLMRPGTDPSNENPRVGREKNEYPDDLYIPSDAMMVVTESFEGPLDLLLYLIRAKNVDILDIQVAEITTQYMQYIAMMSALRLELAAEYLVMAATLAEIKSRMLLPHSEDEVDEEQDPRTQLIHRLQEYERLKDAAERINKMPREEREIYIAQFVNPVPMPEPKMSKVSIRDLAIAFVELVSHVANYETHVINREPLSVSDRMRDVMIKLRDAASFVRFNSLLNLHEGRYGAVVTFLALLELMKSSTVEVIQNGPFDPIYVRSRQLLA